MTREADVVRALVTMADTLVGDYDVVDLLSFARRPRFAADGVDESGRRS